MSSSSSSDEDDDTSKLKEALWAPGFAITAVPIKQEPIESLQSDPIKQEPIESLRYLSVPIKKEPIESLRNQFDEDTKANIDHRLHRGMDISISPEQQNFIAKKLDEYLEKKIKETDILSKKWADGVPGSSKRKGVKLLAISEKHLKCGYVTEERSTGRTVKPDILPKHREVDDASILSECEKLLEAAVSPEWVLKGQGVFGKMCHKGEVITDAKHADSIRVTEKSDETK